MQVHRVQTQTRGNPPSRRPIGPRLPNRTVSRRNGPLLAYQNVICVAKETPISPFLLAYILGRPPRGDTKCFMSQRTLIQPFFNTATPLTPTNRASLCLPAIPSKPFICSPLQSISGQPHSAAIF